MPNVEFSPGDFGSGIQESRAAFIAHQNSSPEQLRLFRVSITIYSDHSYILSTSYTSDLTICCCLAHSAFVIRNLTKPMVNARLPCLLSYVKRLRWMIPCWCSVPVRLP